MFISTEMFLTILILLIRKPTDVAKRTITEFLDLVKSDIENMPLKEKQILEFYKHLAETLIARDTPIQDDELDLKSFILKVTTHPTATPFPQAVDVLVTAINSKEEFTEKKYYELLNEIGQAISWYKGNKQMKKVYTKLANFSAAITQGKRNELISDLRKETAQLSSIFNDSSFTLTQAKNKVDFTDKRSILQSIEQYNNNRVKNVLKFGLKGFNRLFGKRLGLCLGESMVINSLTSNGKSTVLMSIARWIVKYNTPPIVSGIPTVLFISLENEIHDNVMELFRSTYMSITQKDPDNVPVSEMVDFVYQYFNQNGWAFILERRLGADFGVNELITMFNDYKSSGYIPVACIIDYVNLMKKGESNAGANYLQLKDIYNQTRNFLTHENCCMITAHQLNREAEKLASSGIANVINQFSAAHLAEGIDPQREIDIAIYLHCETNKMTGVTYSTFKLGKHRNGMKFVPPEWKRCNYRHTQYGFVDDVDTEFDTSIRDIYADNNEDITLILNPVTGGKMDTTEDNGIITLSGSDEELDGNDAMEVSNNSEMVLEA